MRNPFEHEEEDQVTEGIFLSNNYIEYKSKGYRKTLQVRKYLFK